MALVVKPKKSSQTDDGITLYIYDNTGAYNASTNTGGYGTPNPAYADIQQIIVRVYEPNSTTEYTDFTLDTLTTPTAVQFATPSGGYTLGITAVDLGQSTSSTPLEDGAYNIQEFVLYEYGPSVDFILNVVNGSTAVTGSGAADLSGLANATHIYMDGTLYGFTYVNATNITLDTPYEGVTGNIEDYSAAYMGSFYFYNYYNSEVCASDLIGDSFVTDMQCDCGVSKSYQTAENAFYQLFILKTNEAENDEEAFSRNIETYQSIYCDGDGDCGCN